MSIYSFNKGDQTIYCTHTQPVCLRKELLKSKEIKKYFQNYAGAQGTGMSGFWTAKLNGGWGRFAGGWDSKLGRSMTSDYINSTN